MAATTILGASLAVVGPLHYVAPEKFEAFTATAFPDDTRTWVLRHGAIETALGVGLLVPATRTLARVGLLAYGAHLGLHAFRTLTA
ncbi:MAG: hypothetical protein INR72_04615 [Williamsia herbipolensis]|uniref:DoxX-like protein n=1 Tax=Williamsia serinedens TaxID=391736 RepID=A0ABT1GXH3_9NOCA|nr:hypothetical protein [Williamsia serinedens]MBE7160509.1 hypothetical protein [Williamsia herbipolensis]MCP2159671.1 hypothetical protein [Williamsia serinedens]